MSCSFHNEACPSAKAMSIAPGTGWAVVAVAVAFNGCRAMHIRPILVLTSPWNKSVGSWPPVPPCVGQQSGQMASMKVGVLTGWVMEVSFGKKYGALA